MKKLKLFVAILLLTISIGQAQNEIIELKGITIGSKMEFNNQELSLIGYKYYFLVGRLNDNTIPAIVLQPSQNNNVRRINFSELDKLIKATENKFNIKFEFIKTNEYNKNEGSYLAKRNGNTYLIIINDYNQFMDQPYEIIYYIFNDESYEIWQKEEQERANSDM